MSWGRGNVIVMSVTRLPGSERVAEGCEEGPRAGEERLGLGHADPAVLEHHGHLHPAPVCVCVVCVACVSRHLIDEGEDALQRGPDVDALGEVALQLHHAAACTPRHTVRGVQR